MHQVVTTARATLTAAAILAAGLTGAHLASQPDTTATGTSVAHVTHKGPGRPPYWHRETPRWCEEDMVCWIGSAHDGRSSKAQMRDWTYQLRHLSAINH